MSMVILVWIWCCTLPWYLTVWNALHEQSLDNSSIQSHVGSSSLSTMHSKEAVSEMRVHRKSLKMHRITAFSLPLTTTQDDSISPPSQAYLGGEPFASLAIICRFVPWQCKKLIWQPIQQVYIQLKRAIGNDNCAVLECSIEGCPFSHLSSLTTTWMASLSLHIKVDHCPHH